MKKGFTLIELLVVVLIIGVLTSIMLPQYMTAVERANISEALINAKAMRDSTHIAYIENSYRFTGLPQAQELMGVELTDGGRWHSGGALYWGKKFHYTVYRNNAGYFFVAIRRYQDGQTQYVLQIQNNYTGGYATVDKMCYTHQTALGRKICATYRSEYQYNDRDSFIAWIDPD